MFCKHQQREDDDHFSKKTIFSNLFLKEQSGDHFYFALRLPEVEPISNPMDYFPSRFCSKWKPIDGIEGTETARRPKTAIGRT
jgi:hypothetical protein